jgi:hypothetical protein
LLDNQASETDSKSGDDNLAPKVSGIVVLL